MKDGNLSKIASYFPPGGGLVGSCDFFVARNVLRMDSSFFSPHLRLIIARDDLAIDFHAPRQASVKYLSMSEYIIALRKRAICVAVSLGVFNSAKGSD